MATGNIIIIPNWQMALMQNNMFTAGLEIHRPTELPVAAPTIAALLSMFTTTLTPHLIQVMMAA